jgi:hypothetical protein
LSRPLRPENPAGCGARRCDKRCPGRSVRGKALRRVIVRGGAGAVIRPRWPLGRERLAGLAPPVPRPPANRSAGGEPSGEAGGVKGSVARSCWGTVVIAEVDRRQHACPTLGDEPRSSWQSAGAGRPRCARARRGRHLLMEGAPDRRTGDRASGSLAAQRRLRVLTEAQRKRSWSFRPSRVERRGLEGDSGRQRSGQERCERKRTPHAGQRRSGAALLSS